MIKPVLLCICCLWSAALYGQLPVNDTAIDTAAPVFRSVDTPPGFPGGEQELYRFLATNIRYPQKAVKTGAEGTVRIMFIVQESGHLSNIEVHKSSGNKFLDEEALRVVSAMPAWSPGKNKGELVKVYYQVPITFKMEHGHPPGKKKKR